MVLLATLTVVAQQADRTATKAKRMSAEELKQLVDSKEKFFFLDVREVKELQDDGTLEGYINIPIGELAQRLGEIPKDAKIIAACARGMRAAKAAAILEKNGFQTIGICGMLEYGAKGYPLVHPKAAETKPAEPAPQKK